MMHLGRRNNPRRASAGQLSNRLRAPVTLPAQASPTPDHQLVANTSTMATDNTKYYELYRRSRYCIHFSKGFPVGSG